MNKYSENSEKALASCHDDLQTLFRSALPNYNHTILEGHRNQVDQHKAFETGKSKLDWPDGKHNKDPSIAVDASPYPVDFDNATQNLIRFYHFAGYIKGKAEEMGIKIRWGGDWNSNNDFKDQTFNDLVHFELVA